MNPGNKKIFLVIAAVLIVLAVLVLAAISLINKPKPKIMNPPARPQSINSVKPIYLTFDADMTESMRSRAVTDKITWYDPKLVEYLQQEHVPATIFTTGMFAQLYPELVSSLSHNNNIEIGNHTFDHAAFESPCYNLRKLVNADDKKSEIIQTQEILKNLTGYEPKYFRYPGLCHNSSDDSLVSGLGLTIDDGNLVSGDAFSHSSDQIVRHVLSQAKAGSVIVLHLGGPNATQTYSALIRIVPELEKEGYTLSKLPDLNRSLAAK